MNVCAGCNTWGFECSCPLLGPGEQIKLLPCPLCEGPPVLFVRCSITRRPFDGRFDPKEMVPVGLSVHIFCHECGCQTTDFNGDCCGAEDLRRLEQMCIRGWQTRNNRHRRMYDAGDAERLSEYPERGAQA